MSSRNTLDKGVVRLLLFKEGKIWYGVALEFNIVVHGTTMEKTLSELDSVTNLYIETARSIKGYRSKEF